ncbi:MAG: tetratricopeptide repeat protein [Candidatus Thorarchaeota archaeon]
MSHPQLKHLRRAEQLFDAGEIDKALHLLNEWSQFEEINFQQKKYFQFLKGLILFYQYNNKELIKWGEELFREGQKHNETLQSFDGLFFLLVGLIQAEKFEETFELIEKAEALLKSISNLSKTILIQREIRLSLIKSMLNFNLGNIALAEKYLKKSFDSQKILSNSFEIVWAYILMTQIIIFGKGRFDLALQYVKKAFSLTKEIKFNHYWIATCNGTFGIIYQNTGELNKALKYYMKSLKLNKEFKSKFWEAALLNNIAHIYCEKGDFEIALQYLEKALILREQDELEIEGVLDSLISVALKKGDFKRAQTYFRRLETIFNQKKDKHITLLYKYNSALMLKESTRIRDKAKAEELLKEVIKTETLHFEIIIGAIIHLCDLLLAEFRLNNNSEVLEELNHYISNLLTMAEKSHSYLLLAETYILKAKLALLKSDFNESRRLLTQAQKIAESYGMNRLAAEISAEHDNLLKELHKWEKLKEQDITLNERIKFAQIDNQMNNLLWNRDLSSVEYSDEEPILLLVLEEAGVTIFSHIFTKEWSHDDDLVGGFLSAINSFSGELFSEGLDRAKFGQHTVLMKSFETFSTCYLFKGDSYPAQKKINNFIEQIQNSEEIKETFNSYYKTHKSIGLKENPPLKLLLTDIFIHKN